MKGWIVLLLLFFLPVSVFAGWEVARPESVVPTQPFFQPKVKNSIALPIASRSPLFPKALPTKQFTKQYAVLGQPAALYAVSISGSLKENIERIMGRYHWKVIWKAPYDYNFDGRITGSSLPNVVEKLLQPFPLQAVMYMSNRTVTVVPRSRT